MAMSEGQILAFRDALATARKELPIAEEKKKVLDNEIWQLRQLIDALEIQLGEATEAEVFKRNKKLANA